MHRFTALLYLLAAVTITAQADDAKEISRIDFCRDLSLVAKEIMTARQNKEPMSNVLPAAIEQMQDLAAKYGRELDSQKAEEMIAPLILAAYDFNAYPNNSSWDPERRDAIRDFENMAFESCYENWSPE